MNDAAVIADALRYVSPHERETWVQMAFAVRSALGDGGFSIWDTWSRQADSYKLGSAKSVWRSAVPREGGITAGSLFHLAREGGWRSPDGYKPPRPVSNSATAVEETAKRERRAEQAVDLAGRIIQAATYTKHPYLRKKGFPDEQGLVLKGRLVIPMRSYRTDELQSIQSITADGDKKFLPGGKVSGACFRIGRGRERWVVEGYATGLSIWAVLDRLYRQRDSEVIICFSAANIPKLARPGSRIIADHDLHTCTNPECKNKWDLPGVKPAGCPACGYSRIVQAAGEKYAMATRRPYWMPPDVGDANDVYATHGAEALADYIRELI